MVAFQMSITKSSALVYNPQALCYSTLHGQGEPEKELQVEKVPPPKATAPPHQSFWTRPLFVLILLSVLAALIYSNTFCSSFHFDDTQNIVENPRIKDLTNFSDFSGTRYLGFLSFALNYYLNGLNVFGYHLVNLLIHIANGFLVYSLVLLLFKAAYASQPGQTRGSPSTEHGCNE